MSNSGFGYSVTKNSFKGLNIDCIQYSNIIRITHYLYSYSGTILNPNIIHIRIRPNICARILFAFVFAHSVKTNIIRIHVRSKFWFRILFVFLFGQSSDSEYYSYSYSVQKTVFAHLCPGILVTSQRKLLLISSMKKRFLAGFNFPGAVFGPLSLFPSPADMTTILCKQIGSKRLFHPTK